MPGGLDDAVDDPRHPQANVKDWVGVQQEHLPDFALHVVPTALRFSGSFDSEAESLGSGLVHGRQSLRNL